MSVFISFFMRNFNSLERSLESLEHSKNVILINQFIVYGKWMPIQMDFNKKNKHVPSVEISI